MALKTDQARTSLRIGRIEVIIKKKSWIVGSKVKKWKQIYWRS